MLLIHPIDHRLTQLFDSRRDILFGKGGYIYRLADMHVYGVIIGKHLVTVHHLVAAGKGYRYNRQFQVERNLQCATLEATYLSVLRACT